MQAPGGRLLLHYSLARHVDPSYTYDDLALAAGRLRRRSRSGAVGLARTSESWSARDGLSSAAC